MSPMRALLVTAPLWVLWAATPPPAVAAEAKRYGIEGMLVEYDEAQSIFKVKVTSPKVTGGFGSGGIAGKPASGIASGDEIVLEVVPEGSVLKRTVIKASKGGGLDNSGTKEGFKRAVQLIPKDRAVVLSFEDRPGDPKYLLKMVQIRLSPEEVQKRLRELGIDPQEAEQMERDAEAAN